MGDGALVAAFGMRPAARADMNPGLTIGLLADHPHAVDTVAAWLHREWLHEFGYTQADAHAEVRTRLHRGRLPIALVAMAGDIVVGTASISEDIKHAESGCAWCLSGVFVESASRRRGIGGRLCMAAVSLAERLGLHRLSLYTFDRSSFFDVLGWTPHGTLDVTLGGDARKVTRMRRSIAPPSTR